MAGHDRYTSLALQPEECLFAHRARPVAHRPFAASARFLVSLRPHPSCRSRNFLIISRIRITVARPFLCRRMTFVILIGGIDLSVGSVLALSMMVLG